MLESEKLLSGPFLPGVRIGIGSGDHQGNVERSVNAISADITIYKSAEDMVSALKRGDIDAAIRGTLPASATMSALKSHFQLPGVQRMVIMESREGGIFFMAPVGIDEGWTVDEKEELVRSGSLMMKRLGLTPRVAVMSGGRSGDKGRNPSVDRSIDDALLLVERLQNQGYDAYHAEILLESAVKEANMVIAPDGMSGNIIFRALHFLGGCKALGAPVLNLNKVFIDTSRVKTDFSDSIALALRLVKEVGQ